MTTKLVKELMVPLSDYATVSKEATLYEAVLALEKARETYHISQDRHRAILIYDEQKKIVGKVSQLDVLRALEPKYDQMGPSSPLSRFGLSRFGFSSSFLKSLANQYQLWDKPLDHISRKSANIKVKEFMYTPTEGEYVEESASLNEAIHQLVMGHHQSLLVTKDKDIVGVLRLTDIYTEINQLIKLAPKEAETL
ncbi:MAG: CBS domain-containing protein [Desulfobacterales bacterium]|nr:CBS domain-containing protein [Desulfobacterales bacterium]